MVQDRHVSVNMIIYGVHAVRAEEVRATEVIFSSKGAALDHAEALSTAPGVVAAAVTRLTVDELGSRSGIALYVEGKRQQVPYLSDDRQIHAGGAKRRL